jgi:DNA-binding response OmpR family regulator
VTSDDQMSSDAATPSVPRVPPTVLVADDEEDVRALVVYRLAHSGYRVVEASNGEEALVLAFEERPDVAVLDVMMPKMGGLEVTARLRADEATRHIAVILLTARAQDADVARGFEAGADDYLRKPFSPDELGARVRAVLARR